MSTTERTWDHLTSAERATERVAAAEMLDHQRRVGGSSIDPAMLADYHRREAAAELADSDEEAAIARGHAPPRG